MQGYKHFLLFHAAIRALCHSKTSSTLLYFAKLALEKFVEKCPHFYEYTFLSYNVHALLHLVQDERLGPLDAFSAFRYENNISFFRKLYRKPHRPLQQFSFRLAEREKREELRPPTYVAIKVFGRHDKGPVPQALSCVIQYKKIRINCNSMFINIDSLGDRCILHDSSVCIVRNILEIDNLYYLVINKFEIADDYYNVGISSSLIGIFTCSALSKDFNVIPLHEVKSKCYIMPCWKINNDEDSDCSSIIEGDRPMIGKYIVSVLLHVETSL